MRCDDAIELFTRHRDGDLSPQERQELEEHLAGCGRCREQFAAVEAALVHLRELQPEPAPPGLAAAVRARLDAQTGRVSPAALRPAVRQPERPRTVLLRWALPMAAAALLVIIAFGVMRTRERASPYMPGAGKAVSSRPKAFSDWAPKDWEAAKKNAADARAKQERALAAREPSASSAAAPRETAQPPATTAASKRDQFAAVPSNVEPSELAGPPMSPPASRAGPPRTAHVEAEGFRRAASGQASRPAEKPRRDSLSKGLGARLAPPPTPAAPPPPARARLSDADRSAAPVAEHPALGATAEAPRPVQPPARELSGADRTLLPAPGPSGPRGPATRARLATVAVTAQASTSQVAGRSLTLQLKADDEVDEAQVSLRRSGAAGPETVLWQGRLEKTMTNSLDVRLEPHAATQQLMIRGRQLDTQSYYVFAPAAAKGVTGMAAAVGRPGTATKLPALKESKPSGAVWADVFQGIASEKGVYVLAPAAFPMQVPSGLGAQPAARDVDRALREIGYEQRPLPGAITIEAAPEALPKAARGRSRP